MSCIHYKFRSALEYDTITFDGLSISLADLKHSIITQKKFGKNTDFDLEVTNAQTKEEYKDEMTMIPKNSSVVVRRIPIGTKSKAQLAAERASPFSSGEQKTSAFQDYQVPKTHKLSKVADLANADASEEDKLKAMMKQSGEDWDPSQYVRGRRPYAPGVPVPQSYVCYRCGKPGHFIRNCPTNGDTRFDVPKAKRTTGIPRTFLGTTEGTASPPTRVSPSLPDGDSKTKVKEKEISNKKVPSELRCPMCNSLLTDAVVIPCCGTSYCDDCIRNYLLENEQECPSCRTENVSPDSLVINKQLRQAVNTFKNARPASPFVAAAAKSTTAATNNTEVKSQPAAKVVADSATDKPAPESKPVVENKVIKDVNDADRKPKESSPKPAQTVKPVPSEPQPIRVHHRDAMSQQGFGLKQGGAPFDPRRRQGEFMPRGAPRVPELRHALSEPIIPHGLPPEHVPRVPAVRPNMPGSSHPGPRMNLPGYVPGMHTALPVAAIPHIPSVPTLVRPALPHHPAFGAPVFDPLHPLDVARSLTPPMSEREFYKMQKKLKTSRNKKTREHEHPPTNFSRESRPRKEPRKESKKEPKKDGGDFDFDDELFEYRKLQKSRQRLHSRSLTPSRSPSRSRSRSRSRSFSRSRSPSRSSQSPVRSPTPVGWDESRSPSPASSRDQTASASAEEKKRKHKKRKKEQKGKERKKQKTSHSKEGGLATERKEEPVTDKDETKTLEKKKHKRRDKDKANGKETQEEKDKRKEVVKEKNKKEMKVEGKEKGKKKEKRKGSDKEVGKEKEEKKSKEKKKKKDKDKKDDSSSGKKRKSKKKHKKHKRHKKEKSKDGKGDEEKETSDGKVKDSEMGVGSSGDGDHEEKTSTDDEKEEHEAHDRDEYEQQQDESDEEESESEERMSEEETQGEKMDEEETNGSKERQQKIISEEEEKGEKMDKEGKDETNGSEGQKLRASGSDEEDDEVNENDIDEEKLLGNESDEHIESGEKLDGRGSAEDKKKIDDRKLGKNGSDVKIGNGSEGKGDGGGNEEKLLENVSDKKSDHVNDEILVNEMEREGNEEKNIKSE